MQKMDKEPQRLKPSPPMIYNLNLPEPFEPLDGSLPEPLRLSLEVIVYIAIQDIKPLNEILDTMKVFSLMLYSGDVMKSFGQIAKSYDWTETALKSSKTGQIYDAKAYSDFTGEAVDKAMHLHGMLRDHYSKYRYFPQKAWSKPDKANISRYPSISSVIEYLELNSAMDEVKDVLATLYIITGNEDKAIDIYRSKGDMSIYDYYNLGTAYLIEKKDFTSARENLEKAQDLKIAQYNLGMTYLYGGNWEKAAEYFQPLAISSLVLFDPATSMLFSEQIIAQFSCNNLGCYHYSIDEFREALDWFNKALSWKPVTNLNEGVANKEHLISIQTDSIAPLKPKHKIQSFHGIISGSESMQQVYDDINKVAPTDLSVLITGETGTGKELVARAIHGVSGREGEFIAVNCAAISKDLVESELFGHEKGAFTGANRQRKGAFELADKGTLFLDEIGEMSLDLQPKLLRAIQYKEFTRLGGQESIKVDVRIVSATNRDLEKAMKQGEFRRDLYNRIKNFPIELPPLRKRKGDIPDLIEHFIEKASKETKKDKLSISPNARILLESYEWPGNIRELERRNKGSCYQSRWSGDTPRRYSQGGAESIKNR
jgi:transcriptional regulator with AAA-type ATPase domain